MAAGYFGGGISCITDRCQIRRESPGGQANSFQAVVWSSSMVEVEYEGSTKRKDCASCHDADREMGVEGESG